MKSINNKNCLLLRKLNENDEIAFKTGFDEWVGHSSTWYTFFWKPGDSFSGYLKKLENQEAGLELAENMVADTMLYAFLNDVIIGRFNIRHYLNENLFKRGGHIGYSVAPKYRKNGYGYEIMKQGLDYIRNEIKLKKILVTCSDSNIGSWKIIEKFGGELENVDLDQSKDLVRRYWIEL